MFDLELPLAPLEQCSLQTLTVKGEASNHYSHYFAPFIDTTSSKLCENPLLTTDTVWFIFPKSLIAT